MNSWSVPANISLGVWGKGRNEQLRSSTTDQHSIFTSKNVLWELCAPHIGQWISLYRIRRWGICKSECLSFSCLDWYHNTWNYLSVPVKRADSHPQTSFQCSGLGLSCQQAVFGVPVWCRGSWLTKSHQGCRSGTFITEHRTVQMWAYSW